MIGFISVVLVLVAMYFVKIDTSWCHYRWVDTYQGFIRKHLGRSPLVQGYGELLVIIGSIGLLVLLLQVWAQASDGVLYFLLNVAVLFFVLMSINLKKKVVHYLQLSETEPQKAADFLADAFYTNEEIDAATPRHAVIGKVLQQANQSLFVVLFWFILLGPVGAVVYRLFYYFSNEQRDALQLKSAFVQNILDWVPARLFGLTLALVSHFAMVVQVWVVHLFRGLYSNVAILSACGFAALGVDPDQAIPSDKAPEKELLSLLVRAALVWLVAIALLTVRFGKG